MTLNFKVKSFVVSQKLSKIFTLNMEYLLTFKLEMHKGQIILNAILLCIYHTLLHSTILSLQRVLECKINKDCCIFFRYLLLDVYTNKDKYNPESEERLYESSSATPVTFDPKPNCIAVSNSGRIIACSTGRFLFKYQHLLCKANFMVSFSNIRKRKLSDIFNT
jgi:hypothetical protein